MAQMGDGSQFGDPVFSVLCSGIKIKFLFLGLSLQEYHKPRKLLP